MHFPKDRAAHITAFDGPIMGHWLELKVAQTANTSAVQDRSDDLNRHRWVLYGLSYIPLPVQSKADGQANMVTLQYNNWVRLAAQSRLMNQDKQGDVGV